MRHFVLQGSLLSYYNRDGDETPRNSIDLTTGRGVRTKDQCRSVAWPIDASDNVTFGLAIESRMYYFYGRDQEDVK